MKKSTKILSLILSVLTLLSVFSAATPVFAEEVTALTSENAENVNDVTVSSEETETEENEEAEIVSEMEDMRTEYTKYFRMSDGSYMAAQYAQPVHYEENGEWKEYDYSIIESENEFVIENSDSEISFPEEFSEDNEAQIEVSAREYDIKFSPVVEKKLFNKNSKGKVKDHKKLKSNEIIEEFTEEAPIDESADKNAKKLKIDNQKSAIAYEEFYSNVDLEYEISSNQIKESIVLNSKQDKNKFEFTVDTDGLFPKKETDGSITLYEDEECTKPVSSIMKPYMYDANGEFSYDVTMDIKEKKGAYILTVKASNKWLNDKARKYPVVIDPTIELDVGRAKTYDCYVDNSQASTSFPYDYYIYAGYNSCGKTRTFIKFDLPALPDNCSVIQNASIYFWQLSADMGDGSTGYLTIHNVTKNWANDRTVTWNAQPTYNSIALDYCKFSSTVGACYSFDITKSVKDWYEGSANYGLMLKSWDESKTKRTQLLSAENYGAEAYPVIQVTYRNNKGLESYWSYSSYSNDTAGAAYINDYTGNLVYELPILSSVSEMAPLTLTAYFNNYCANTKFSAGKDGSSKTTPGKGFRLNVQQTVLPSSQYGLTGDAAKQWPYVYTDADGTEHYIEKTTEDGKTVYKDEDGLNLTLIAPSGESYKYRISDKLGNRLYFNDQGNLYCQKDANDNAIRIYFKAAASNFSANQMIDYIVDGAGHKFTFDYYKTDAGLYNGYIKSITDNADRKITFTTTSGLLRKVTYSDGTATKICYCGESAGTETNEGLIDYVLSCNNYALNFDYTSKATGRQILRVIEYAVTSSGNKKGQVVSFDRTKYNSTVIRTAGLDGYHYDEDSSKGDDDILTTLQFDDFGRTISQQQKYGSGGEIGAGNYSYTSGASTLGSANKIGSSASLGKTVVNLATNIGAETTGGWTGATTYADATQGISNEQSYVGKKSFKLSNSSLSNASGGSYYYQGVTGLTGGETYTFSAYVKVTSVSSLQSSSIAGASLALVSAGSANNFTLFSSEKLTAVTDTAINNGWRRISVTMTLPTDATGVYIYLELRSVVGTAYFDNIQLESGSVANSCNLIENGSFEKYSSNKPSLWSNAGDFTIATNSSGTVLDGSSTSAKKQGSRSLRVAGSPGASKGMSQTIPVYGSENDTYILSGWAKGYAVKDTFHKSSKFEIAVKVNYSCYDSTAKTTTTVSQYKDAAVFNTTINDWQYSSTNLVLKYKKPASGKTYTPVSITIVPRYCFQSNYAYFDYVQLLKDVAQSYVYDDEGNVVSASANAEQKNDMTYDGEDLKTYKDALGYKSTFSYDDNHNLTTAKTARGLTTNNTYNANGTLNTTEIQNSANTMAIKTQQGYHGANSSEGIKSGSYLKFAYDEHGNKTQFNCTWDSGIPTKTIAANGVETVYSYNNAIKSRLTNVASGNTNVGYSYVTTNDALTDRVSQITYSGTVNGTTKNENYSYVYDDYGNVKQTKVGSQPLVTNNYNAKNGVISSLTYGNGNVLSYKYNNAGLMTSVYKDSTSASYSWQYASDGTVLTHRDAENNRRYMYSYDAIGRLIRQEIRTNESSNHTHLGSTEFGYDTRNNLTRITNEIGGKTYTQKYLYSSDSGNANASSFAKDNLISRYVMPNNKYIDYNYDSLNRLNKTTLAATNRVIYKNYTYKTSNINTEADNGRYRTTQLSTEYIDNSAYTYYYDVVGNITQIKKSERTTADSGVAELTNAKVYRTYAYDNKNQLTREDNTTLNKTTLFAYDGIGNITSKTEYNYTAAGTTPSSPTKTIKYIYGNDGKSGWNNLLTGVDLNGNNSVVASENETITYDKIGNPTKYLGADLTWFGRQLKSFTKNGTTTNYTYNVEGIRGSKTVGSVKSEYQYINGLLMYEKRGNIRFYFFYDATGNLTGFNYFSSDTAAGTTFYTTTNSQGDVIGVYSSSGGLIATYEYDAWGKLISLKNNSGIEISQTSRHVAALNPIRYRGYYYDSESDLYYIASRYYDANTGRFINSDTPEVLLVSPITVTDKNVFSYCDNNPINRSDLSGCFWETAFDVFSLCLSVAEVCKNPKDPWAWVGLAGDTLDLIPFVTGVGEVTRGLKVVSKAANQIENISTTGKVAKNIIKKSDGFSSFNKLKKAIGSPGSGNEWHHIVEQSQIGRSGFATELIQNPGNIIAIDKNTHRKISGYYSSKQPFSQNMTVRDWLAGQSFEEQYQFGIDVINMFR